jgi:hypothetical protein
LHPNILDQQNKRIFKIMKWLTKFLTYLLVRRVEGFGQEKEDVQTNDA